MPIATDIYNKCDDLDNIPPEMKDNYLHEGELLAQLLPQKSLVLQIGSMDGERIIRLLNLRPDLQITGLEIEEFFVDIAKQKTAKLGLRAEFIHGDITSPPSLPIFDYVICLNNTLGYIPDQKKALDGMRKLGKKVIISVYGERFNDQLARQYFTSIGLEIKNIQDDIFIMEDFTAIHRYDRKIVKKLGGDVTETPAGYFCMIDGQ